MLSSFACCVSTNLSIALGMKLAISVLHVVALAFLVCNHALRLNNPTIFKMRTALSMSDVDVSTMPTTYQVFVGNLPFEVDEGTVKDMIINKAGSTFQGFRLTRDNRTGRSRGFGYLDFAEKADADAALLALTGMQFGDREIKVDHAVGRPIREEAYPGSGERTFSPSRQSQQENSCFIGNLDFGATEEQIMNLCNEILGEGVAVKVRIATDRETSKYRVVVVAD